MTVLCYHAVEPGWRSPLAVDPEAFAAHCLWLARHRHVVPLADAVAMMDDQQRLPRGVCALTFDDGFASLEEHALPMLRRYGLPATVFLVAQTLTRDGRAVDWVDTPPPYPMRTLTRSQVLQMQEAGVTFGSHSWRHADLRTLDPAACEEDLRSSRELLGDLLGVPVPFLAYPRGFHDETVRAAAHRAGYAWSFALPEDRERPEPHAVPRVGVHPGNGTATLRVKTQPWYLPVRTSPVFPVVRRALRRPVRAA